MQVDESFNFVSEDLNSINLENYIGKIFRHFKGNFYLLLHIVQHTETGEYLVVYKALYGDCKAYARPKDMFLSKVDKNKYPNANQEYRFEPIEVERVNEV
ncbi:DUF1653 domain-containing protein [Clostridium aestuarii]|uniref:DUF1653 domain-containing protein n=1 Tax=Clostridium aestuarii TaxID=338193 RepID=A0ABT4CXW2_9CLOT|nr:DUF1653 domain-containing protein [Clostridium aestuarii]MCY6483844.1 DUF1653 domain-containing protein [Clostridium aestuarii]